jgi:hypothetical protein
MPSKFRIILAPTIDMIVMIGLFFGLVFSYIIPNRILEAEYLYGIIFLYLMALLIVHLIFLKFGFASFGHFVLGLAHVSGHTGRRLYRPDFIELWFKSIGYGFKYQDIYIIFHFFTSEYNQSIVYEDNDIFIVKYRRYKKMISNKELIIEA